MGFLMVGFGSKTAESDRVEYFETFYALRSLAGTLIFSGMELIKESAMGMFKKLSTVLLLGTAISTALMAPAYADVSDHLVGIDYMQPDATRCSPMQPNAI